MNTFATALLASLTLMISAVAVACPDLSGTYECKGRLVGMTQKTVNGVTEFQTTLRPFFGNRIIVSTFSDDGVIVNVPEGLDLGSVPASFRCEGVNTLRLDANYNDLSTGATLMTKFFSIDENNDLKVATNLTFEQGGSRGLSEVCRRK